MRRWLRYLPRGGATSAAAQPQTEIVYSIGIYAGQSPYDFAPAAEVSNPVLTRADVSDARALFVADPFMLQVDGLWYMFFEAVNGRTKKGEIGLAISPDARRWTYQQIVLAEPFHLSYPYVFEYEHEFYMIPESYQASAVRLYRALQFPTQWACVATLLEGQEFVDASIFAFEQRWWLLAGVGQAPLWADALCLYYAEALQGPWRSHPQNPIVADNRHIARPAGRVLVGADGITRYTQDCDPAYGLRVHAFRIDELTPRRYRESAVGGQPILSGSGEGWNASGMHHIDAHDLEDGRWIACVDGWREVLKHP